MRGQEAWSEMHFFLPLPLNKSEEQGDTWKLGNPGLSHVPLPNPHLQERLLSDTQWMVVESPARFSHCEQPRWHATGGNIKQLAFVVHAGGIVLNPVYKQNPK